MLSYKETIIQTGQYTEVEIYPVIHHPKARHQKYRPTTEAQQHINEVHSIRKLARLVHTNFTESDYALHLTYNEYNAPDDYRTCERDVKNFILRLRRKYEKLGLELKYIYAIEYGSRWHAHLIVNGGLSRELIEKVWGKGYANADNLQFTENGVVALANYIQKQHIAYRRWTSSKNLQKPKRHERAISKKETSKLCENWDIQSFVCERYPGYFLVPDDSEKICNPTNGLEYVRLFLCKTDAVLSFIQNGTYEKFKKKNKAENINKGVVGDECIEERWF